MTARIVHFEFAGPDEAPLQRFYGDHGALREARTAEFTIGVEVDDLDASLARGVELGGSVVMPPTDNGYVNKAQIADPAGNLVTLIAADKSEAAK